MTEQAAPALKRWRVTVQETQLWHVEVEAYDVFDAEDTALAEFVERAGGSRGDRYVSVREDDTEEIT